MTASALLAALFVGSFFHINLGPEVKAPDPYDIPAAYEITLSDDVKGTGSPDSVTPDFAWWISFNEPVLNKCINEAFARNRDLETALARVQQARAFFREARGNQRPNIGAEVDATRTYTKVGTTNDLNEQNMLYGLGAANYEADLWGKLQSCKGCKREHTCRGISQKQRKTGAGVSGCKDIFFSQRD
jgi:multidrug efflux system outer membrane protein